MPRPALKTNKNRTEFSKNTLRELEDAFSYGMTNTQACLLANISESLFYEVCKNNNSLSERFKALQESPKIAATKNIINAINQGDVKLSQWYLERRMRERFNPNYLDQNPEPKGTINMGDIVKQKMKEFGLTHND